MNYLSVCSGIEAATCAWHPLGWNPFAFSEIEKFPSQVLAHHYPSVPNLGDMTKFEEWPDATIDLLVGGTPCQSFSVAGLRKGLADPRGNLMLTYGAIARRYRPKWLVWENVPGVLSSNGGRDFGTFLGMLGQLGYGFAYRVLDAQFFGVAQRRRRVFVVGCFGDWRSSAAVLFERHSLQGNPAPSREAGKIVAPCLDVRAGRSGETTFHTSGGLVPQIARCDTTGEAKRQDYETCTLIAHSLRGEGFDASEDGTGRGTPIVVHATQDPCHDEHVAFALGRNSGQENAVLAFDTTQITSPLNYSNPQSGDPCHPLAAGAHVPTIAFSCKDYAGDAGSISPTLRSMGHDGSHANAGGQVAVASAMQVRRLTPRECERLQGFPDDYTLIPVGKKMAADGPRYKALGNSMAVPCMTWIGKRIQIVEQIKEQNEVAA